MFAGESSGYGNLEIMATGALPRPSTTNTARFDRWIGGEAELVVRPGRTTRPAVFVESKILRHAPDVAPKPGLLGGGHHAALDGRGFVVLSQLG